MASYVGFFHPPVDGSSWGVTFPDVPGCTSAGDSFEEAFSNANDALSGHLAGEEWPVARSLDQLRADPEAWEDAEGAVISIVVPRKIATPRARINVTLDPEILRLSDRAAEAEGRTRSGFIEEALRTRLGMA